MAVSNNMKTGIAIPNRKPTFQPNIHTIHLLISKFEFLNLFTLLGSIMPVQVSQCLNGAHNLYCHDSVCPFDNSRCFMVKTADIVIYILLIIANAACIKIGQAGL